jgi:hypothetical protein
MPIAFPIRPNALWKFELDWYVSKYRLDGRLNKWISQNVPAPPCPKKEEKDDNETPRLTVQQMSGGLLFAAILFGLGCIMAGVKWVYVRSNMSGQTDAEDVRAESDGAEIIEEGKGTTQFADDVRFNEFQEIKDQMSALREESKELRSVLVDYIQSQHEVAQKSAVAQVSMSSPSADDPLTEAVNEQKSMTPRKLQEEDSVMAVSEEIKEIRVLLEAMRAQSLPNQSLDQTLPNQSLDRTPSEPKHVDISLSQLDSRNDQNFRDTRAQIDSLRLEVEKSVISPRRHLEDIQKQLSSLDMQVRQHLDRSASDLSPPPRQPREDSRMMCIGRPR